jgi:uncharacterized protein with PQ loop repeat
MVHGVGAPPGAVSTTSPLEKVLPVLSILTMVMTVPQVWAVWVAHDVAGVSLLSWATYLLVACVWFVHGVKKRDKTIYVACIGWILLDGAVVAGLLVHG